MQIKYAILYIENFKVHEYIIFLRDDNHPQSIYFHAPLGEVEESILKKNSILK